MIFDMNRQVVLFVFSLLTGMTVGISYDFYRVIRGFQEPGKVITAIQDILFWILTGIIVFILMMQTNYAFMNFNVFVYNAIGVILYFKIFSEHVITMWKGTLDFGITIIRIISSWLFYPLRIVFHKLRKKT